MFRKGKRANTGPFFWFAINSVIPTILRDLLEISRADTDSTAQQPCNLLHSDLRNI
jgi:hypothetical protein